MAMFLSCLTMDDGVELFFMGEGSLQYFFPSRDWKSEEKNVVLKADWLYRNYSLEGEEQPRTLLNFSLYSQDKTIKQIPREIMLLMDSSEILIPKEHIEIIYVDREKTRYSAWLPSESFLALVGGTEDNTLEMRLYLDRAYSFLSGPSFRPHLDYIRDVLPTE